MFSLVLTSPSRILVSQGIIRVSVVAGDVHGTTGTGVDMGVVVWVVVTGVAGVGGVKVTVSIVLKVFYLFLLVLSTVFLSGIKPKESE